jgi:hypothetical protein
MEGFPLLITAMNLFVPYTVVKSIARLVSCGLKREGSASLVKLCAIQASVGIVLKFIEYYLHRSTLWLYKIFEDVFLFKFINDHDIERDVYLVILDVLVFIPVLLLDMKINKVERGGK